MSSGGKNRTQRVSFLGPKLLLIPASVGKVVRHGERQAMSLPHFSHLGVGWKYYPSWEILRSGKSLSLLLELKKSGRICKMLPVNKPSQGKERKNDFLKHLQTKMQSLGTLKKLQDFPPVG